MIVTSRDEICPINEQLLFSLYDAAKHGLPVPVSDVPQERRSLVAVFCYRRSHLERAALAVAATCNEDDLVEAGGALGRTLFLKSRDVAPPPSDGSPNSLKALMISLGASQKAKNEDDEDKAGP
jgi:hypothetical protein